MGTWPRVITMVYDILTQLLELASERSDGMDLSAEIFIHCFDVSEFPFLSSLEPDFLHASPFSNDMIYLKSRKTCPSVFASVFVIHTFHVPLIL